MKFELIKDAPNIAPEDKVRCEGEDPLKVSFYITPEDKIRWAREDPNTYIWRDIGNGKILLKHISECTNDEILSAEPYVFLTESEVNRGANNDRPRPQGNRNNS